MDLTQKTHVDKGTHYYFHSAGKWFLLIKHCHGFDTELRYGCSEEKVLASKPFRVTAVQPIKNDNGIGIIQHASFCDDYGETVLLSIADVTIIAREYPLSVTVKGRPFEYYYNMYLNKLEVNEEHVLINLPDDDITRIVMLIDAFYDATDAEYHFGTSLNVEYYQYLSAIRDSIMDGDIEDLLKYFRDYIVDVRDDEPSAEYREEAKKIITELFPYQKAD